MKLLSLLLLFLSLPALLCILNRDEQAADTAAPPAAIAPAPAAAPALKLAPVAPAVSTSNR
ncbi:MAG TPA: hypothetical protein VHE13_16600 [Opitutus sp.]|nr:hypothetical protein [Opitutus sp.]